jgi:uncharacterized protein YPO0396
LEVYRKEGHELSLKLESLRAQIDELNAQDKSRMRRALSAQVLQNTTWQDIDVGTLLTRIADLEQRIEAEKAARPDLARLDSDINKQKDAVEGARKKRNDISADLVVHRRAETSTQRDLSGLREEYLGFTLSPTQIEGLQKRIDTLGKPLSLGNLSDVLLIVNRAVDRELREAEAEIQRLGNNVVRLFEEFVRKWAIDVQGLDAKLNSAPDFFNKLTKLELDDLPRFENRFREMLRHQSDQTLANLLNRLGDERTDMLNRLDMVNDSLKTVPFNKDGSRLQIDASDKMNQEVREFRRSVTESLSQTFDGADLAQIEVRFLVLKGMVRRLSSQDVVGPSL